MTAVWTLILAGGAGTRFWPASRKNHPKQFLPLVGASPMLTQTIDRVAPLCPPERVLIATGAHLVAGTAALASAVPDKNLLVEPVPRNTAPAIGWAAHTVARTAPNDVVIVLPSDHAIGNLEAFRACLRAAVDVASSGRIVTLGITPTGPETGYGYIEMGSDTFGSGSRAVARFVEKPSRDKAEAYIKTGNYVWNAGMFIFQAGAMKAALAQFAPELSKALDAFDQAAAAGDESQAVNDLFPKLASISIDYAVMEKSQALAVIPGEFGWNDVGSWESAWNLASKDANGNHAPNHAVLVDAHGNHVLDLRTAAARDRVIAIVGANDLVVVETDDGLLVMPRSRAQDVKAVVDQLTRDGRGELV